MHMVSRRTVLSRVATSGLMTLFPEFAVAAPSDIPKRLVFVHGRGQQGRTTGELKKGWLDAFEGGAGNRKLPTDIDVFLPFFGDTLQKFVDEFNAGTSKDIQERGQPSDEYLEFQYAVAEQLRKNAKISDAQIEAEYGNDPKPRGPQNWAWVQAIARALDRNSPGIGETTLEAFTTDVFLYVKRRAVRDAVNKVVADVLNDKPTVIVAHSLGTIVAYNILRSSKSSTQVPLLVTLGSPLALRAVREVLEPIVFPDKVGSWYNAFDTRDIVSLYSLDPENFPITGTSKTIENNPGLRNETDNRHGISGYLNKPAVVSRVLDAFGVPK